MTGRLIPRREVLAFIALTSDEASAPNTVEIREYVHTDGAEWHVIDLTVDSEAAVRFWAGVFGHPENRFHRSEPITLDDGTHVVRCRSQNTGWRGFTTEVAASIGQPAEVPLDERTAERLREIAGP